MEKDSQTQGKIIQTYAEDMAKVIENDKEGLIKKIIHGEEQHEAERKNLSPESEKNKFFMFVSLLLIFLALVALFFFFFKKNVSTIPIEEQFVPIIFNDKSDFIEVTDFSKDEIIQTVWNVVNTTAIKYKGLGGIYLTYDKKVVGLRKFIALIKSNFVPSGNDLVSDNFLMGAVNNETQPASGQGGDFFVLLKVRTLSDIFDSMRAWENKMFFDLHGFFGIGISSDTKYLITKEFQNGIVENKNARILYDRNNRIVLMYILADDTSVIITNTENAAREIILRLASSQIKK